MLSALQKNETIKKFGQKFGAGENDAGCSAVQIALLTQRINGLKDHFNQHAHDFHSGRGLYKMVGQRRSLLRYYKRRDEGRYRELIKELNLRK